MRKRRRDGDRVAGAIRFLSMCRWGGGSVWRDPGKEAKQGEDIDYGVQLEDEKLQMKVGL